MVLNNTGHLHLQMKQIKSLDLISGVELAFLSASERSHYLAEKRKKSIREIVNLDLLNQKSGPLMKRKLLSIKTVKGL